MFGHIKWTSPRKQRAIIAEYNATKQELAEAYQGYLALGPGADFTEVCGAAHEAYMEARRNYWASPVGVKQRPKASFRRYCPSGSFVDANEDMRAGLPAGPVDPPVVEARKKFPFPD